MLSLIASIVASPNTKELLFDYEYEMKTTIKTKNYNNSSKVIIGRITWSVI